MLIRLRDSYTTAGGVVTLDVTAGEGQKAYIEVCLDDATLASGSGVESLAVGSGPAISGKRLRVTSTVTDTNPSTNHTSVTYRLSGGQRDSRWTSDHDVDADGGTVDYDAIFTLL